MLSAALYPLCTVSKDRHCYKSYLGDTDSTHWSLARQGLKTVGYLRISLKQAMAQHPEGKVHQFMMSIPTGRQDRRWGVVYQFCLGIHTCKSHFIEVSECWNVVETPGSFSTAKRDASRKREWPWTVHLPPYVRHCLAFKARHRKAGNTENQCYYSSDISF